MLHSFVRLTLFVAAAIAVIVVLAFVLKIVIFAAIVAALVLGVLFIVNLFRRRSTGAAITRY